MGLSSKLFALNIRLNGLKAVLYCFGLSEFRYIQYSAAIRFLDDYSNTTVLDLGSGRSIFPTLLSEKASVVALDLSINAIRWQKNKNRRLNPICGSITNLPFRSESFELITCISTIEHVPGGLDIKGMAEVGRILKPKGIQVQVLPISISHKAGWKFSWVPIVWRTILGGSLNIFHSKFKVDDFSSSYYERCYREIDILERIIKPSRCILKATMNYSSHPIVRVLHLKLVPHALIAVFEYLGSKLGKLNNEYRVHSSMLKLEKPQITPIPAH